MFAGETAAGEQPRVTRAAFAAALQAGDGDVQLDFVASDADRERTITRSEAAQVIAEFLELQAIARMTGARQRLAWHSRRRATPPSAGLLRLCAATCSVWWTEIIESADYWAEHAVEGQQCDGARVAALVAEAANVLEPDGTAASPVEVLARYGIVGRPEYWTQRAQPGAQCSGTSVATLISNLSRQLARRPAARVTLRAIQKSIP